MKNKHLFLMALSSSFISSLAAQSISVEEFKELEHKVNKLQNTVSKLHKENRVLQAQKSNDSLQWSADFRTSVDNINYSMANGTKQSNDALLRNRLWLNMHYQVSENIKFGGQLAYNKLFGQRSLANAQSSAMDGFDWVSSQTGVDDKVRVRSIYIDYMDSNLFGQSIPWSFGIGRRPSNNGKLSTYREDDEASSPLAHIVNAEFDGGNIKFKLESLTGLKGSAIKLAAGRGMSNAEAYFTPTPYSSADSGTKNINMYALNITPYKTSAITTELQYTHASNLIDIQNSGFNQFGSFVASNYNPSLERVGDIELFSTFIAFHGIKGIHKYLDQSTFFMSLALSQTDPDKDKMMLGSTNSELGHSYWMGVQMPSLFSQKGKWGLEYNYGSRYWRSFTYAEDTAIGSKIATRGDAYEIYFTEPLAKGLSFQVRYTYIDYKYSGSNGFFGAQSGSAVKISSIPSSTDLAGTLVDTAKDLRCYLRYRF